MSNMCGVRGCKNHDDCRKCKLQFSHYCGTVCELGQCCFIPKNMAQSESVRPRKGGGLWDL